MTQRLGTDQEAAIQVMVGYCAPELYYMLHTHGPNCLVRKAAIEVLALAGLSIPQFLEENAERLGLHDDEL